MMHEICFCFLCFPVFPTCVIEFLASWIVGCFLPGQALGLFSTRNFLNALGELLLEISPQGPEEFSEIFFAQRLGGKFICPRDFDGRISPRPWEKFDWLTPCRICDYPNCIQSPELSSPPRRPPLPRPRKSLFESQKPPLCLPPPRPPQHPA